MLETIPDDLHRALEDLVDAYPNGVPVLPSEVKGRLRRAFGTPSTELLWSVLNLQKKARKKLGDGVWWATDRSLQQATAWQVAKVKSEWLLSKHHAGSVVDICCGGGGDTISIARRLEAARRLEDRCLEDRCLEEAGRTEGESKSHETQAGREGSSFESEKAIVAIDRDPLMAAMVRRNLNSQALAEHVQVVCESAENLKPHEWDRIHVDPDRRIGGQRVTGPDLASPSWGDVVQWVRQASGAILKLAPAAKITNEEWHSLSHQPVHRVWISLAGQVREQTVLCGEAIPPSMLTPPFVDADHHSLENANHSAVVLNMSGRHCVVHGTLDSSTLGAVASRVECQREEIQVGDWMIDPDAAIRSAGLTESFAHQHALWAPGQPSGFLVGRSESLGKELEGVAVVGRVIWVGSADDRKLRRALRDQNAYPGTIKVRGTQHDPAKLAKRYRSCGEREVTLWISRGAQRVYAVMTTWDPAWMSLAD